MHHAICRGIEKKIVFDDMDRDGFVERMCGIADKTATAIYAWTLMSNHAHILLRSGPSGISDFMRVGNRKGTLWPEWTSSLHRHTCPFLTVDCL